jgi:Glyoxalase-like domain
VTRFAGRGPRIWFQVVWERKAVKNRLHLDISVAAAARSRSRREGGPPGRSRRPDVGVHNTEGLDHYAVAMKDPEGNKFDIN